MEDEVLLSDEGGEGEGRKGFGKELEGAFVVFCLALTLKAVDLVHVVRLVVAAVDEEGFGVEPFVGVEEEGNFGGPGAAVDKVAVEEVVVGWGGGAGELE